MNIHEYQAKTLFEHYAIPTPKGRVAKTALDAQHIAQELTHASWVVKAQIHAGGRGKVGGVKVAQSPSDVFKLANDLLGKRLITQQTDAQGLPIECVLIEKTYPIQRELYLSLLVERSAERLVFVASSAGGMDIEAIAHQMPKEIITVTVHPATGLQPSHCRKIGYALKLEAAQQKQLNVIMHGMMNLFLEKDASQIEINPLIQTQTGELIALDAKINFDDNALALHPDILALRDINQEDAKEYEAAQFGLNYIALEGNIGCMVNGAGLAMATMDLVKLKGGLPANFLDVGGGTNVEKVCEAFKLILADGNVKAVLVNIFGGIVKCDIIAEGILAAMAQIDVHVPVVVRLEGTNASEGRALLNNTQFTLYAANDLNDAAQQVVALAQGVAK
jgi:succinyl-CoA synthetase beta subunit